MASIVINGVAISVSGNNISMINGDVYVDGVKIDVNGGQPLTGDVRIKFEGDIANLRVDRGSVEVTGHVTGDVKAGGSVRVGGEVSGSIDAGGSVECGNVEGNVDAGGSIKCGNIGGDADAGGSIRCEGMRQRGW